MNKSDLTELILANLRLIAPDADVDELNPDDNLREALDIDSFDHLNFLIGLNQKLGVDIPEKDYGKLNTLREVSDYLLARVPV